MPVWGGGIVREKWGISSRRSLFPRWAATEQFYRTPHLEAVPMSTVASLCLDTLHLPALNGFQWCW